LEVHGLSRAFGAVRALDGVSFGVQRGEVVGLIGPNGAGKTTLLECLAGVQPHDDGSFTGPGGSAPGLFYLPESITPWETRPVSWVLRFIAAIHGTPWAAVETVTAELALAPLARRAVGALSRGQRKRLLLAIALLTNAPVLLLDEPFDGLDLRQVRDTAAVLRRHAAEGRTLILSIHQLADAARYCDRVVMLNHGAIVGDGTLAALRERTRLPHADLEEIYLALT
jgi:ABC-2 type transport system ATP-binding protein